MTVLDQAATGTWGDSIPKGKFSCVVDDHPRFHLDAFRWFASLTRLAGVDPGDLVVHVTGRTRSEVLDHLRCRGVSIRSVDPFDKRSPHCNKISGAFEPRRGASRGSGRPLRHRPGRARGPARPPRPPGAVAAKPVDAPCPPLEVLVEVFTAAGLPLPPTVPLPWGPDGYTVAGNCNGGLYLVPGDLIGGLAASWEHWARWLLDRRTLLAEWAVYVDQVAMCLALAAESVQWVALAARWNTPTHDLSRLHPDAPRPAVIHYHQELDREGRIRPTGVAPVDQRIREMNETIRGLWREAFPRATFWQWRNLTEPSPGPDTRGREQWTQDKRAVVSALLEALGDVSVLDVGCGDSEATRGLPMSQYEGIDVSQEALRRARAAHPEGHFFVGTLADHPKEADLVLCLDVLVHEPDPTAYRDHVAMLWKSARVALVVSGFEQGPREGSPILHFHEPLSVTLSRVAPESEVYPIRAHRGTETFVVLRPPPERHPRDFGPDTLSDLIGRHPDPMGLVAVRAHAWRTMGFYPDHAPRLWEYPVVARLITEALPAGSSVVDVGAGVTPLAPFLASRGYVVDTVDPSPTRRTWPPQPDWNEWEFLDYRQAGLANRSWNCTLAELPRRPPFDCAYSVSVIEHLPATERRGLLADISSRLRPGGLAVLTVDLKRGTDDLWNRSRGVQVEDQTRHGTVHDLMVEASRLGLGISRFQAARDWGDVPVDIGLLTMRRAALRFSVGRRWPLRR